MNLSYSLYNERVHNNNVWLLLTRALCETDCLLIRLVEYPFFPPIFDMFSLLMVRTSRAIVYSLFFLSQN